MGTSLLLETAKVNNVDTSNLRIIQLDVTNDKNVSSAIDETLHYSNNRIDALINNAGEGLNGTVESVSLQRAQRHFDLNVWGVYRLVQAVAPVMRAQGDGGHIVTVSSASAFRSLPGFEVYASSKFA